MLGTEKRVRTMYGDEVEGERQSGMPFADLAAYMALLLSIIALITLVFFFNQKPEDQSTRLASIQGNMASISDRVAQLEARTDSTREAFLDSQINEVAATLQYLNNQNLSDDQRARLEELTASGQRSAEPAGAPRSSEEDSSQTQQNPAGTQ
ncbi:MAG: hypothetical protein ACLFTB_07190 [Desulfovibrionales bacterium]